jgi:hypothetical protein
MSHCIPSTRTIKKFFKRKQIRIWSTVDSIGNFRDNHLYHKFEECSGDNLSLSAFNSSCLSSAETARVILWHMIVHYHIFSHFFAPFTVTILNLVSLQDKINLVPGTVKHFVFSVICSIQNIYSKLKNTLLHLQ